MLGMGRIGEEEHRIGERDRVKGLGVLVCVMCVSYKGGVAFWTSWINPVVRTSLL